MNRISRLRRMSIFGAIMSCALGIAPYRTQAQTLADVEKPQTPLILDQTGSFFIGGETVYQSAVEIGLFTPGPLVVNQTYVQFMIPHGASKPAVVMIHGAGLSGKSFETTPDGRMGWYEYFARRGYGSYVVDQVGRARSGFGVAPFNDARAGVAPAAAQPNIWRIASDRAMVRFRIGTADGTPFPDTQFPVNAAGEFAKQSVPDLTEGLPSPNPNYRALADLAKQLKRTVLLAHSQAGRFPFEAALLGETGISAIVAIEPGSCNTSVYTGQQIAVLARFPILIVFGDHLAAPQPVGVKWNEAYEDCRKFVAKVNAVGGNATMYHPPDMGIKGNSHMIMEDRNNLQIADYIMNWIDRQTTNAAR